MGLIPVLLQAWITSGKSWTGVIVILGTYAIQHYLPALGMDKDAATIAVTTIVQGVGYIILIIGAIDKIIKAARAKKAGVVNPPAVAVVNQQAAVVVNPPAAGTVAKLLVLGLLLFGICQVQAKETFSQPFAYLYMKTPPIDMRVTDGLWVIKPAPAFSFIGIARGEDGYLIATPFPGAGAGISVERLTAINGSFFTSISLSANAIFSPIEDTKNYRFSGTALVGTTVYPFGVIGIGPGFDGKKTSFAIGYVGSFGF
jgi:hypothetical protein